MPAAPYFLFRNPKFPMSKCATKCIRSHIVLAKRKPGAP
jgi:hypothetical protein